MAAFVRPPDAVGAMQVVDQRDGLHLMWLQMWLQMSECAPLTRVKWAFKCAVHWAIAS